MENNLDENQLNVKEIYLDDEDEEIIDVEIESSEVLSSEPIISERRGPGPVFFNNMNLSLLNQTNLSENLIQTLKPVKKEKKFVLNVDIGLDTEYVDTTLPNGKLKKQTLTLQIRVRYKYKNELFDYNIFVVNEQYKTSYEALYGKNHINPLRWNKRKLFLYYANLDEEVSECFITFYLQETLTKECPDVSSIYYESERITYYLFVHLYFQIKDLTLAFGVENMLSIYKNKNSKIFQRNGVSGYFKLAHSYYGIISDYYVNIKDLKSITTAPNLKSLIERFYPQNATASATKTQLDAYKTEMNVALQKYPEIFLDYSMQDATILLDIMEEYVSSYNEILKNVLHISETEAYFNTKTIPMTLGATVKAIFLKYLKYNVYKNNSHIELAMAKLAILNPMSKQSTFAKEAFEELLNHKTINSLNDLLDTNEEMYWSMHKLLTNTKNNINIKAYQYCSIKWFLTHSADSTMALLAMTSGGRTVNERPKDILINYGCDIDISGAYGSELNKLIFPIGKPTIWCKTANTQSKKQTLTLGQFIKKHAKSLESKLYKIVVSGKLSFEQDLINSKIPSTSFLLNKSINISRENNIAAIDAPFPLLRMEIINATITADLYETLKKVCTTQELKEINNLEVEAAAYWAEENKITNIEEFAEILLADTGKYEFNENMQAILDTRTYKWFPVYLKDFIKPLQDKRAIYKKQKDNKSQAIQNMLKEITNCFWGLLTSVHFEINNTVLSEIVTTNIRTNVWLMSKALNTHLSITDGGPFSLMEVSYFNIKSKKPGLHVLSSFEYRKTNRNFKIAPLNNIDWINHFKTGTLLPLSEIDKMANDHVRNFWKKYNIDFLNNLESKNTFYKGSTMLKAHYFFKIYDYTNPNNSIDYFKIRSFKLIPEFEEASPTYLLLKFIVENDLSKNDKITFVNKGVYRQYFMVKLSMWRKSLIKNSKNKIVSSYGEEVLPGDVIIKEHNFRLNNTHFPIIDKNIYNKRNRRSLNTKIIKLPNMESIKIPTPLFEQFLESEGILSMLRRMNNDFLR